MKTILVAALIVAAVAQASFAQELKSPTLKGVVSVVGVFNLPNCITDQINGKLGEADAVVSQVNANLVSSGFTTLIQSLTGTREATKNFFEAIAAQIVSPTTEIDCEAIPEGTQEAVQKLIGVLEKLKQDYANFRDKLATETPTPQNNIENYGVVMFATANVAFGVAAFVGALTN